MPICNRERTLPPGLSISLAAIVIRMLSYLGPPTSFLPTHLMFTVLGKSISGDNNGMLLRFSCHSALPGLKASMRLLQLLIRKLHHSEWLGFYWQLNLFPPVF